jgi:hypothetical protein
MKTIGLIGGMSWESTVSYYRLINTAVKEKLGGLHSATGLHQARLGQCWREGGCGFSVHFSDGI